MGSCQQPLGAYVYVFDAISWERPVRHLGYVRSFGCTVKKGRVGECKTFLHALRRDPDVWACVCMSARSKQAASENAKRGSYTEMNAFLNAGSER